MSSSDSFRKFCAALVLAMMAMSMVVRMLYGLSAWLLCRNSKPKVRQSCAHPGQSQTVPVPG
jgi:hypothetical protein